jgi:hypothetical protein
MVGVFTPHGTREILSKTYYSYFQVNRPRGRGTALLIGVNLTRNGRLETASTQTKPASAGFKSLIFCQSA